MAGLPQAAKWDVMNVILEVLEFPDEFEKVGKSDTPREAGGLMSWAASKAVGPWV